RDCPGRVPQCERRLSASANQDVNIQGDKLDRHPLESLGHLIGKAMFQPDVSPLHVAKGSETFKQSLVQRAFFLGIRGMPQNSNCRNAALLLSVRGERRDE